MSVVLSEHLPLLATAPDGIQKLRGLILGLAVRGKLVSQDPNDEPARALLARIAQERAGLGGVKNRKTSDQNSIGDRIPLFELPESWAWVGFGEIALHNAGKTLDKGRNSGQPRDYITTSNLYWGRFELGDLKQMLIGDDEMDRCTAMKNDLLICEGGEAGRAAVWPYDRVVCFQNHVHRARFFGGVDPYFGYYFFEWLNASGEIDQYRKGVGISNMSGKALASIPFTLPPLEEQYRIVAKIDELMALCDRLQVEQADAESAHAKLVETLLGTLTQSTDATDFTANWQRLAEHFDTLFTTESSLDALKQTILQLAVMGKIVQPDPEDEPASELLKRIAQERGQLGAKGIHKKLNETLPIEQDEQPHPLPGGWAWCRFREIATANGRLVDSLAFPDAQQVAPDNIEKGTGRLIERRTVREAGVRGPNQRFKAGQLLYSKIRPSLSKAVIVDFDGLCSADMYPLDSYIPPKFLLYQILSETFLKQVRVAENRIKMPKLNQESLNAFLVGVPPLMEQHRIVAKLDELLALCDRLKAGHADACSHQERLTKTLIESALKAA